MLNSLFSAFLMYSRLPMPQVEWKEENRRYALGFFPLVGAVIGGSLLLWQRLCSRFGLGQFIFSAGAVLLPVLITGGIHIDGFCDVTDARASYGSREKRLEIMSDPHIGSFAVLRLCLYLIFQAALYSQADLANCVIAAWGYVLSRALSGLAAVTVKSAKSSGTLHSFVSHSHRTVTAAMEIFFIVCSVSVMAVISPAQALFSAAAAVLILMLCIRWALRELGGITGDVCGWLLQLCEIGILAAAVLSGKIMEVLR